MQTYHEWAFSPFRDGFNRGSNLSRFSLFSNNSAPIAYISRLNSPPGPLALAHIKPFYGRSRELAQLQSIAEIPGARLIVIKGRRWIEKSRLAMELGDTHPDRRTYYLTGVPPRKARPPEAVLDDFAGQISRYLESHKLEKFILTFPVR